MKLRAAACAAGPLFALACGGLEPPRASERQPIVYDADDRLEYNEIDDELWRSRLALSSVALVADRYLDLSSSSLASDTPTLAERAGVCSAHPFAEQPAAAFCSGVLVEQDLILTAGHCLRAFALSDFSVVFGYYYQQPEALALGPGALARPVEIVAEALDAEGVSPRRDYGWLRLAAPAPARFQPVPIHVAAPALHSGDAIATIGAASGVPLKLDATGLVSDPGREDDFFIARTDTSSGWSGGGAFDSEGALVGVLARGAEDLQTPMESCAVETMGAADRAAEEQFSYAHVAVRGLCDEDPSWSLCRRDCGDVCLAEPKPEGSGSGGCAMTPRPAGLGWEPMLALLLAGITTLRRQRRAG